MPEPMTYPRWFRIWTYATLWVTRAGVLLGIVAAGYAALQSQWLAEAGLFLGTCALIVAVARVERVIQRMKDNAP